jgi:SpoVK/Ycf46/Vps4 family AAA+-type ATPase
MSVPYDASRRMVAMGTDRHTMVEENTLDSLLPDAKRQSALWLLNIMESEDIHIGEEVLEVFQFSTKGIRDLAVALMPKISQLLGESSTDDVDTLDENEDEDEDENEDEDKDENNSRTNGSERDNHHLCEDFVTAILCTEGLAERDADVLVRILRNASAASRGKKPDSSRSGGFNAKNSHVQVNLWINKGPSTISNKLEGLQDAHPDLRAHVAKEMSAMLRRLVEAEDGVCSPVFQRAKDAFRGLFNLGPCEFKIMVLLFFCKMYRQLNKLFLCDLDLDEYSGRGRLAVALGVSRICLMDALDRLEKLGLIFFEGKNISFNPHTVARLWELGPGEDPESVFRVPLKGDILPLSEFNVDQEGVGYILDLLEGSKEGGPTRPIHILLYGPPGTGKSSFARSLAASLGAKAWAVAQKDSGESGLERRLYLNVALNRAARRDGAMVVVDEAENVLGDRHFLSSGGLSVDKGWINWLMERPGSRVLWIVNNPDAIDATIRRRFSHSLHFTPLGAKGRERLWGRVLARHGALGGVPGKGDGGQDGPERPEILGELVRAHKPPASVIDRSVRQAKERGGDFWGDVALGLKAYEELERDGKKVPMARGARKGFTLDGVSAGIEARPLIERLKAIDLARGREALPAGFGTMLFFGPPGTGKSAMARHLAHELGKGLLIKRASDILGRFAGQGERNLAGAFREAEDEDALLVIDEADSFLCHRDMAVRSWEIGLVNEFLASLGECRCFLVCTSNRREGMDPAAMRRFSFKVPFRYAGPKELRALYMSLLAPLAGDPPSEGFLAALARERNLAPGDFHAVLSRNRLHPGRLPGHLDLLRDLTQERDLKLERGCARIGY